MKLFIRAIHPFQTGCEIRWFICGNILESHLLSVLVHVPCTGHVIAARIDRGSRTTFHHGCPNDLTNPFPTTSIARRQRTNTRRDCTQIQRLVVGWWCAEIGGKESNLNDWRRSSNQMVIFRWMMKEQRCHTHVQKLHDRWHTITTKIARTTKVIRTTRATKNKLKLTACTNTNKHSDKILNDNKWNQKMWTNFNCRFQRDKTNEFLE